MKPILTANEVKQLDASSAHSVEDLVARAGFHVYITAKRMLKGLYGRRVLVIAGPGNNGADGRYAAAALARHGASVHVIEALDSVNCADPKFFLNCDLLIDAAFGVGFRGEYIAPQVSDRCKVLAVDIPSGVSSDSGDACQYAQKADETVTFAAYKPGHFLSDGPDHTGELTLCDIGINAKNATMWHFGRSDASAHLPVRSRHAHKWNAAMTIVGGSPGMNGAATLVARSAMRAGAGMVHALIPGGEPDFDAIEAIRVDSTIETILENTLADLSRSDSLVIGPGLGRGERLEADVREIVAKADVPIVVDGDALFAFRNIEQWSHLLKKRSQATILTPHMGEFHRLGSHANVLDALRRIAKSTGAYVLLKGPTSMVASPEGKVVFTTTGGPRLATAGTGDCLAGVLGALLAQGLDPMGASAMSSYVHGAASLKGYAHGLIASDLPPLIAETISELEDN